MSAKKGLVPKAAKKMPVEKEPVENPDLEIQEGKLNINKLRTVMGHGRVSVAADERIKVMEFVH